MGPLAWSNKEKANIFTLHSDEHDNKLKQYLLTPVETQKVLKSTNPREIKDVINLLNIKKWPSLDITEANCSNNARKGLVLITHIFKRILRLS